MSFYGHPNQIAKMQTTTTRPPLTGFFVLDEEGAPAVVAAGDEEEAPAVVAAGDDVAVSAEAGDWVVEAVAAAVGEV